ncbi:LamG domain-containing protein [uncultured Paraglaciecola sp.]|uniref:LamG domain-containing protein n=1 Tax=uncultured Paraglaciecola sp. TaxID=1765024 RepID=UPI0026122BDB|nr:LamG domain-containing protein [uncultured Paraglaciecola sp.]
MFTFPTTFIGSAASAEDPTDTYGEFDGSNDYVTVPDDSTLQSQAGASGTMSIAAWINPSNFTTKSAIVSKYANGGADNAREFLFRTLDGSNAGKLILGVYDTSSSNYDSARSTNTINTSEWSHVVVTFDNSESGITNKIQIYINGTLETMVRDGFSGTFSSIPDSTTAFEIGVFGAGSQPFTGGIAEVRYYGDVLTADEVTYLNSLGASGTDPTTTDLEGHWKFDEGTGTTVGDSTANGNDGTATNITEGTFWNP